jgi:hypothetical protein
MPPLPPSPQQRESATANAGKNSPFFQCFCDHFPMANFLLIFNVIATPPSMGSNISQPTHATQSCCHQCNLHHSTEKKRPVERLGFLAVTLDKQMLYSIK